MYVYMLKTKYIMIYEETVSLTGFKLLIDNSSQMVIFVIEITRL